MPLTDNRTDHLSLPLPHRDNLLWDDVIRIIDSLKAIDAKAKALDDLLASDDVDLDALQELVAAIKENRASIDGILTSKLNVYEFNRQVALPMSVQYTYNGDGLVSSVTETVAGKPRQTTYTYNAEGMPATATITYDGKTRVETYDYSAGRVASVSATET